MAAYLSKETLAVIQNTIFFRNEAKLLIDAQCFIFEGYQQLHMSKLKLVELCHDCNCSPFQLYEAINKEKEILEKIVIRFNKIMGAIRETTQDAISTHGETQRHLDQLYDNGREMNHLFNSSLEILIEKSIEREEAEAIYKDVLKQIKRLSAYSFFFLLPFYLSASKIKSINNLLVGSNDSIGMLFLKSVSDILCTYLELETADKIIKITIVGHKLLKLNKKIIDEIMEQKHESHQLILKLQKLEKKIKNKCLLIENQKRKVEVFREMVKVLCKFNVILRQWQVPLDEITNIYCCNFSPPSYLHVQAERNQRKFVKNVKDILEEAKPIYEVFEYKPTYGVLAMLNTLLYPKTMNCFAGANFGIFNSA